MAKFKKEKMVQVDFAAFRPSAFEGVKKEDFLQQRKGSYLKQFKGYADAEEREAAFLNSAWEAISAAQPKETKQAPAKGAK